MLPLEQQKHMVVHVHASKPLMVPPQHGKWIPQSSSAHFCPKAGPWHPSCSGEEMGEHTQTRGDVSEPSSKTKTCSFVRSCERLLKYGEQEALWQQHLHPQSSAYQIQCFRAQLYLQTGQECQHLTLKLLYLHRMLSGASFRKMHGLFLLSYFCTPRCNYFGETARCSCCQMAGAGPPDSAASVNYNLPTGAPYQLICGGTDWERLQCWIHRRKEDNGEEE